MSAFSVHLSGFVAPNSGELFPTGFDIYRWRRHSQPSRYLSPVAPLKIADFLSTSLFVVVTNWQFCAAFTMESSQLAFVLVL